MKHWWRAVVFAVLLVATTVAGFVFHGVGEGPDDDLGSLPVPQVIRVFPEHPNAPIHVGIAVDRIGLRDGASGPLRWFFVSELTISAPTTPLMVLSSQPDLEYPNAKGFHEFHRVRYQGSTWWAFYFQPSFYTKFGVKSATFADFEMPADILQADDDQILARMPAIGLYQYVDNFQPAFSVLDAEDSAAKLVDFTDRKPLQKVSYDARDYGRPYPK